ncbi:MAG: hypothetical protein ACRDGK_10865, partial [Actinomycetota bacterium]
AVSEGTLLFGEGYDGNLHVMPLPGPTEGIVARFDGGITDIAPAPDGSIWVVTPNALYRRSGPIDALSPTPGEEEPPSGLVSGAGLLIAAVLIGGLLLMRTRLLRR